MFLWKKRTFLWGNTPFCKRKSPFYRRTILLLEKLFCEENHLPLGEMHISVREIHLPVQEFFFLGERGYRPSYKERYLGIWLGCTFLWVDASSSGKTIPPMGETHLPEGEICTFLWKKCALLGKNPHPFGWKAPSCKLKYLSGLVGKHHPVGEFILLWWIPSFYGETHLSGWHMHLPVVEMHLPVGEPTFLWGWKTQFLVENAPYCVG